jgi:hypothetical protein
MPIHRRVSPLEQTLVCVSEGAVTLEEVFDFFDAVTTQGLARYRKLFDATRGHAALSDDDLKALMDRLKDKPPGPKMGPLAVVTRPDQHAIVRILRPLATLDRPLQVFRDIHSARAWLNQPRILS